MGAFVKLLYDTMDHSVLCMQRKVSCFIIQSHLAIMETLTREPRCYE